MKSNPKAIYNSWSHSSRLGFHEHAPRTDEAGGKINKKQNNGGHDACSNATKAFPFRQTKANT
jgi:hypothetical protein